VHVLTGGPNSDALRFSPKAAKLYRSIRGRRATATCIRVSKGPRVLDHAARAVELFVVSHLSYALPRDWAPTVGELLDGAVKPKVVMLDGPDASPLPTP
jgi:hypothetical protein